MNKPARWMGRLLVLLMVLLTVGCDNASLQEYSSTKGRFSVMSPGELVQSSVDVNIEGTDATLYLYMLEQPDIAYQVSFVDFPGRVQSAAEADEILDASRDGHLMNIGGRMISEEPFTDDNIFGREIRYTAMGGQGSGHVLIMLAHGRLYQAGAIGAKASFPADTVQKFVDSFEVWE